MKSPYFICDPVMYIHGRSIQAKIEDKVPEIEPHWWEAKPIISDIGDVTFSTNLKTFPDNFFTGTIFDLYSGRLINLLKKHDIKFETFPTQLIDRKTKQSINTDYQIFHLLEMGFEDSGKLFFRHEDQLQAVFIHADLKAEFETAGITGFEYLPYVDWKEREARLDKEMEELEKMSEE